MKKAVWIVFVLMGALWTGAALLFSELTQWGGQLLESGHALTLGESAAQWTLPAWASAWVDTAWMHAAQEGLMWVSNLLQGVLPMAGSAAGWVVAIIWVVWGVGLAAMFLLAGVAHLLAGRIDPQFKR